MSTSNSTPPKFHHHPLLPVLTTLFATWTSKHRHKRVFDLQPAPQSLHLLAHHHGLRRRQGTEDGPGGTTVGGHQIQQFGFIRSIWLFGHHHTDSLTSPVSGRSLRLGEGSRSRPDDPQPFPSRKPERRAYRRTALVVWPCRHGSFSAIMNVQAIKHGKIL